MPFKEATASYEGSGARTSDRNLTLKAPALRDSS